MKKYFNRNTRRKTEWTNDEKDKMLSTLDLAIVSSDGSDDYCIGFKNGLRYAKSLIDGNDPQYEHCQKQVTNVTQTMYSICKENEESKCTNVR